MLHDTLLREREGEERPTYFSAAFFPVRGFGTGVFYFYPAPDRELLESPPFVAIGFFTQPAFPESRR
jgi:hypothetical protein